MKVLFFVLLFLTSSCSTSYSQSQIYKSTLEQAYSTVGKKEEMIFAASGENTLTNKFTVLGVVFLSFKKVDINEAREMVVRVTGELQEAINGLQELQPHMYVYPFPIERFEMTIVFVDSKNLLEHAKYPHVAFAGVAQGHILYGFLDDQEKPMLELAKKESYQEALKILKK